ncbi:hypothetical protein ACS0TY_016065 [Phlomoides rotata]
MARESDDLEFWLPSEFLTDDDLLTDFRTAPLKTKRAEDFPYGFGGSYGFGSDLSSPVTETDSDDDELIAELTRKLAHSALQNSSFSSDYPTKAWNLSGSPQSTLCGCKAGSRGSPNSISGVCSPPDAEDQRRWDLLYAAAGEVARMRLIEETAPFYSSKLYAPQAKPTPVTAHQQTHNLSSPYFQNPQAHAQSHLSYQMLQAAKFRQMKEHQMLKNRAYAQGSMEFQLQSGRRNGGDETAHGLSVPVPTWPTSHQPHQKSGSGMRAVFVGESAAKKERTGTGVFLPQRYGSFPTENRKKSGCPTVLLPERVVHALNSTRDSIDAQVQQRSFNPDYDAAMRHRNNLMIGQQQRRSVVPAVMNQQFSLPQEWTY